MSDKILVVDDDPMIVDVLTRFLKREGYEVVTARNGVEALEKVGHEQPDLILLDVTMPEMDGFTVCRRLKDDSRTALIPITMITGLDDREHRTRGIESGADDFLTKPFEQGILRARIRSQLRTKHLIDQLRSTERAVSEATGIEDKEEHAHKVELLKTYKRRLRVLEQQVAKYGLAAPAHVLIEIEEIRDKLEELEKAVRNSREVDALHVPNGNVLSSTHDEVQPVRRLRVFLCHATDDKPAVRSLYQRLVDDGVDAWLDEEKLLPGQDWKLEITKAVRTTDVVLVCLSSNAVSKAGYVQTEITDALRVAEGQPEGAIFIIPLRLQKCTVPERLAQWQWVDFFEDTDRGYSRLVRALSHRAEELGLVLTAKQKLE